MSNVREIITLSVFAGLGLAIILNADKSANVVNAVSNAWLGLIRTVSGTDPTQR